MQVLSDQEWKNLVGDDFSIQPIQFCFLLKALFGADKMERIVTEAISYAKESSEGSIWTGHGRRKRHPRRPVLRLRRQTLPPCCRCSRC